MRDEQFQIRKGGIFSPGKEIEGLRGGVHKYAAQENPKIDTARAEKDPSRTEVAQPLVGVVLAKGADGNWINCLLCSARRRHKSNTSPEL